MWSLVLVPAIAVAVVSQLGAAGQASTSASQPGVAPNARSEVDCNGWSPAYRPVKPNDRSMCTDPIAVRGGHAARFIDNGWYVGHDEPSVKFISNRPGSGNQMTYFMRLPADPSRQATASGSVTDYGELSIAPWFGLPICDPQSYPQNSCTPDSDSNLGSLSNPADAGSAFLELQLYPPKFGPFTGATLNFQSSYGCRGLRQSREPQAAHVHRVVECSSYARHGSWLRLRPK